MSNVFKNTLNISFIYTGTVIGAGFSSGREVLQFFTVYGEYALIGIILCSVLFALLGISVLHYITKNRLNNFSDFLESFFSKEASILIQIIIYFFVISTYCIMLSGSGALLKQHFNLSYSYGIVIMSVIVYIVLLFNLKGLSKINSLLIPLMLVITFTLTYKYLAVPINSMLSLSISPVPIPWFISAILYFGYNSLISIAILSSLSSLTNNKKTSYLSGGLTGLILGFMLYCIWRTTNINFYHMKTSEIPMLYVAKEISPFFEITYVAIIWTAMLTTALSTGYSVINKLYTMTTLKHSNSLLLFCIACIPLSTIQFSVLIKYLYSSFGFIGIVIILLFLFKNIINVNKSPKKITTVIKSSYIPHRINYNK